MDVLPELIRVILNMEMQAERVEHLNAAPYQRTQGRNSYTNSFKPKTMQTRVVSIFPNQAACLRLVSAILNEISEEWLTGRRYLSLDASTGFYLFSARFHLTHFTETPLHYPLFPGEFNFHGII